jgi:PAS domain S-box-containing protein
MTAPAVPGRDADRVGAPQASRPAPQPEPDAMLDGLVRVAAQALACPAAAIRWIDAEQQTMQAAVGLPPGAATHEPTLCRHAMAGSGLMEVSDARTDARFAQLPLVAGDGPIRFYAGMPIGLDGQAVGTLCVIDRVPRTLSAEQRGVMADLSRAVEHWLLRRREQQAQQREQAWLRKVSAAVEQASEAIVITDLEARIDYVNDAALRGSGYSRSELIGHNAEILRGNSVPERLWHEIRARVTGGRPWRGALHSRRKDGSLRLLAATVAPVRDERLHVSHLLAITHDVTDKHRLRGELERWRERLDGLVAERTEAIESARAAAEAASKAKSAFLATMSHEIRTPMNGVIGAVELLQRSPLSSYQRELAATVHDSAQALLALLDSILDFSKIEAGHLDIERAPLDLRDLLEHACDALQPLAMSRGVHLHLFIDPALPALLLGDAVRLRQVVTNLLGNAIKFCAGLDRPGRVAVRAWPLSASAFRISVGDNGIGLSADAQARLFQPFMQAEQSTTRRYGGTGLGLAICQRLAVAMGGHIGVASQPGEGARFHVDLPLAARAGAPPPLHDLTGLTCHVAAADNEWAADWAATLAAAGAYVTRWSALPSTAGAAWREQDTVLLIDAALLEDAEPVPVPCVLLQRGRRRSPRVLPGQCVVQDIEGMHGDALLAAVALAAGRLHHDPTLPVPLDDALAPPVIDTALAAAQGCLVLVAEDDETNRLVLQRQFALLGVAAWQQWRARREAFGLLLTDLHMPGMDGMELTAAIRNEEGNEEAGAHRMPIVALTASALRGETAHCKAAGMDDALSKPIQIGALGAAVRHWLAQGRVRPSVADDAGTVAVPAFDDSVLVRAVGRNADALAGIRSAYVRRSRKDFEEMQLAVERAEWSRVAAVAHRWKSASQAVGAVALAQRLQALERACRHGGAPGGETVIALQAEMAAVESWLGETTPI